MNGREAFLFALGIIFLSALSTWMLALVWFGVASTLLEILLAMFIMGFSVGLVNVELIQVIRGG